MEQDHQKKESLMQSSTNIIDKNWKDLIKPNKLNITSSDDKSFAKVVAEPLRKRFWSNYRKFIKKNFIIFYSRSSSNCNSN